MNGIEPVIQSVGPPPERHADRIVAEMMRQLSQQRATLFPAMVQALSQSADGNARAQRKMQQRIRNAGAFRTELTPGKRGQYRLTFFDLTGWDASRDAEIGPSNPIPIKPWLACHLNYLRSEGKGREERDFKSIPVLFVTHHVLSRTAQRYGATTCAHLIAASHAILETAVDLLLEQGVENWLAAPPNGHRVQFQTQAGGTITLILKRHDKRKALVAATIF
jgi:hypothetical protein